MSTLVVRGPASISGDVWVPGDKSISHRALMIGALARGRTTIDNVGPGGDVAATRRCLTALGVSIDGSGDSVIVDGRGMGTWTPATAPLDCANSGTTMRMLAGLVAHYDFRTTLDGDPSLRRRPMDRVVRPLRELGARVEAAEDRFAPLTVEGGGLVGTDIDTGVASAQVKSCVLFAGLAATGSTVVTEPFLSRDHTERMLRALGVPISTERLTDGRHRVEMAGAEPSPFDLEVPGDPSSAAFLVAAAVLCGGARVTGLCLNPTRIGFLEALVRMGAAVRWETDEIRMGEPVGHADASRSDLTAIHIDAPVVPTLHDELPLVAVLATRAAGTTTVEGASELRVKESDRVFAIGELLRRLGAHVEERPDGFAVEGPVELRGAEVDAGGDHRMAMAAAVGGLVATGETRVGGFDAASVSWPGFEKTLAALGVHVEVR